MDNNQRLYPVHPNGYRKFYLNHLRFYLARLAVGIPVRSRCLRRPWKTAGQAERYGLRFWDRWQMLHADGAVEKNGGS
jgi:hypothetical protein